MSLSFRGPDWKPARAPKRKPTRIDHDRVIQLHGEGLSQPQIGRALDINAGTVSRILRRHGVPTRAAGDYLRQPSAEEIRELYELQKLGIVTTASRLGVGVDRLSKMMRQHGISVRRPGRPDGPDGPTLQISLERMRPLLRERSGGRCEVRCSDRCRGAATHTHHRKLRKHGDHSLANLLHVCIVCHGIIHKAERIDPYAYGWLLHSWDDPASVPMLPYQPTEGRGATR